MKNLPTLSGKDNLDEIVFSNRNKAYGAYVLRNEYSNQLTKAVYIGVAFFASISIIPLIVSAFSSQDIIEVIPAPIPVVLENVDTVDNPNPQPQSTTPEKVKTVESTNFTPVRVLEKDKPIPTEEDKKNAAISSETSAGKETTLITAPPVIKLGPPVVAPYTAPAKADDPNKLINQNEADVAADFKGGINAFRQKVAQNFDTGSVAQDGMISAVITFVVEKDGTISDLKINGSNADFNSEAERVVKSIKTKWSPAQLKGKAVRSSFRMPISMKIE